MSMIFDRAPQPSRGALSLGAVAWVLLLGGVFVGMERPPAIAIAGIGYLALCGTIPPIIAWADRAGPGRQRTAGTGCLLLALSPLLIGVAILAYDHGSARRNPPVAAPSAPMATPPVARSDSHVETKSPSDVSKDNAPMPTYQIEKVPDGRFAIALGVLFFLSLPIVFGAYGAFLGGRAVRFFRELRRP